MKALEILRGSSTVASLSIDEKTVFSHSLMGGHKISVSVYTDKVYDLFLGDKIVWEGGVYTLNRVPALQKISNTNYLYNLDFESRVYSLFNKLLQHEGASEFSYHGTAEMHLQLLLDNSNSIDSGWQLGTVSDTIGKTLNYSNTHCRGALQQIATAFELEWQLEDKTIYMSEMLGADTTLVFEYGQGKGLYQLNRAALDSSNVCTRVYGYGAAKNLKYSYREGQKRLVFEGLTLEANTDLYGIREGVFTDDTIFPNREGRVTSVSELTEFKDTTLDFDINDHLLEGVAVKVVFTSGAMSGYAFEITRYRHSIRSFELLKIVEENDYELPNDVLKISIGDTYRLVDLDMPESYIAAAEQALKEKTQAFLDENSHPKVQYTLVLDPQYLQQQGISLAVGDRIRLLDTDMGVDKSVRISQLTYPLVTPFNQEITLADSVSYTLQERLLSQTLDTKVLLREVDRSAEERSRQASHRMRSLQAMLYDADGYFDPAQIRPFSIETAMLSVGAKAQHFVLNGVQIECNYLGNPASVKLSEGSLVHYELELEDLGYTWQMASYLHQSLQADTAYYIYAKCSQTALTGSWLLDEIPQKTDALPGHYLFSLGVLFAEKDGRRDFDFSKGMTYITGDMIKTGKIQSMNGLSFISLNNNSFRFGGNNHFIDWNNEIANKLLVSKATIRDAIIEDADIGDWILNDGVLQSKAGGTTPNIELDSLAGEIRLEGGEIRVSDAVGKVSVITEDGILSNAGNTQVLPSSTGITARASIAGLGFGSVNSNWGNSNFLAGVFGSASNSGSAPSYGGYFLGLYGAGLHLQTITISGHTNLGDYDTIVIAYLKSGANIYLPSSPQRGRRIEITNVNNIPCTVRGNGNSLALRGVRENVNIGYGATNVFTWDASYWHYSIRS